MSLTRQIVIDFPMGVDLPEAADRELVGFVEHLCKHYEKAHPGRVMWAFGIGAYPVHIPLTDDDPRPMQFDDAVFHIEVAEREAYDWPCATCGLEQEQHELLGNTDCAFVPADRLAYLAHRKAVRQARRDGSQSPLASDGEGSKREARGRPDPKAVEKQGADQQ